jgi:hypothetical protein
MEFADETLLAGVIRLDANDLGPAVVVGLAGVKDPVSSKQDLVGDGDDGFLLSAASRDLSIPLGQVGALALGGGVRTR